MESLPQLDADIRSGTARPPAARPQAAEANPPPTVAVQRVPAAADWLRAPVLAAIFAAIGIVAVHWTTAASVLAIWVRSETFAHGFLVVPLALWLVYRQRERLAPIAAAPWWPGLVAVLGAGCLWLVMTVAHVLGVTQFALAFMVQAAIVTVVGLRVSRALIFPLAFLLFAIPAGEIFVPTLIEWTANFTVGALRASGVPVYREANQFVIPSGTWSVVEACSGIRYIIASVMVGTIYAAIAYRSWRRRALFVAASIVTPIVANWLRAYMIVMLGHLSNNQIAVGVDHLIYGWLFFGLVILLLFWVGSFWREAPAPAAAPASGAVAAAGASAPSSRLFAAALACIVAAGIFVPLGAYLARQQGLGAPIAASLTAENGWEPSATAIASWQPHYRGFAWELQQAFHKDGREIGVYIAYYRDQANGRELVTSGNQLTTMEDAVWKQMARDLDTIDWAGERVSAERTQISGPSLQLDVLRLFWIDGRVTASEYAAKALTAWSRLTGRGDDSALIVVYAPKRSAKQDTAGTLADFAQAMSPSIARALHNVRAN